MTKVSIHYYMASRTVKMSYLWGSVFFILLTGCFVGIRSEHIFLAVFYLILFISGRRTRQLGAALLPFVLFGVSYDWMRAWPNYLVNPIDVSGIYDKELALFGVTDGGTLVTLCEYFNVHNWAVADFFAGIFYLCWVPVPIIFGLWLYFKRKRDAYLRFALVFLLVNVIGFAGYYIYPAAPPWYAIQYGFEPILNTPGNVAGLGRFDALMGVNIFESIYGRNSNVFAAVPSLHSAYMVVALYYAIARKCGWRLISLFSVIMVGIWATAVYSSHHYVIDVLLGISCALAGIFLFEFVLMNIRAFRYFFWRYYNFIKWIPSYGPLINIDSSDDLGNEDKE